ncbi:hypothetical protein ACFOPQ_17270 [Deinococcus antarcticus]|uniref:HTH cro/C1-type domain-containing protein n=1 Tax=Deinococcus antarcticus TaxID=1298767 RepID=A0ABV8ABC8_9DEIO
MAVIRQELAKALTNLVSEMEEPDAQIAARIGMTRQRLNQLKVGGKDASPEAIERAINALGYQIVGVKLEKI